MAPPPNSLSPLLTLGHVIHSQPAHWMVRPMEGWEVSLGLHKAGRIINLARLDWPEPGTILIHGLESYLVKKEPFHNPPYFPFPDPGTFQCLNVQFLRVPLREWIGRGKHKRKGVIRIEIVVSNLSKLDIFSGIDNWCYYGKEVKRYKNKETPWSKVNGK